MFAEPPARMGLSYWLEGSACPSSAEENWSAPAPCLSCLAENSTSRKSSLQCRRECLLSCDPVLGLPVLVFRYTSPEAVVYLDDQSKSSTFALDVVVWDLKCCIACHSWVVQPCHGHWLPLPLVGPAARRSLETVAAGRTFHHLQRSLILASWVASRIAEEQAQRMHPSSQTLTEEGRVHREMGAACSAAAPLACYFPGILAGL